MKLIQQYAKELSVAVYDVFLISVVWYGVSLVVEMIWPGVIVRYFNLNLLLLLCLVSGGISVALGDEVGGKRATEKWTLGVVALLGVVGVSVAAWSATKSFSDLWLVVSLVGVAVVAMISYALSIGSYEE